MYSSGVSFRFLNKQDLYKIREMNIKSVTPKYTKSQKWEGDAYAPQFIHLTSWRACRNMFQMQITSFYLILNWKNMVLDFCVLMGVMGAFKAAQTPCFISVYPQYKFLATALGLVFQKSVDFAVS